MVSNHIFNLNAPQAPPSPRRQELVTAVDEMSDDLSEPVH